MHKTWVQTIPGILLLAAIVAKLRDAFNLAVPTGYQDQTGFHTGVKPPKKQESWPPFW
jgi:hypothetical protein